jgi:antitoxin component YwqK of YwqJK toxin-antitoxin module
MKSIILVIAFLPSILAAQPAQTQNQLDAAGKKDGPWKGYYDESRRIRYEGTFSHGKETGVFTFYDDTKAHNVYATRDFSKSDGSAYTTFYTVKHNKVSEGNIIGRDYDGEWKYYHEDSPQIMTVEHYRDGKLEGKRTVYYKSGKVAEEATYTAGVKNGPYKNCAENGTVLEEGNYKNGQLDGTVIFRTPENRLASKGPYADGIKKGLWEYYEDGKLKKKVKEPQRRKFAKRTNVPPEPSEK